MLPRLIVYYLLKEHVKPRISHQSVLTSSDGVTAAKAEENIDSLRRCVQCYIITFVYHIYASRHCPHPYDSSKLPIKILETAVFTTLANLCVRQRP
jgi:hypothetical protein